MAFLDRFVTHPAERPLTFDEYQGKTGIAIFYTPNASGSVTVEARFADAEPLSISFPEERTDEAHIFWMEITELLSSRAKQGQNKDEIRRAAQQLLAVFHGEKIEQAARTTPEPKPGDSIVPNPGKSIEIEVDGVTYQRLPIKTRLITTVDTDIAPIVEEYVRPHLQDGDMIFVSEKAVCITQGLVRDMSTVRPTALARLLARNVGNYYGTAQFHGFGHGTDLAMQLFIEEAGVPRILFAALVSALTRPFGIRGLFYWLSGKRAKSIDCPMSFLILEYAHSVKLAPNNPNGVARRIKERLGHEAVILDANYRGAFSLGKSSRSISEKFIGSLFRDNPLGQSDEMTPFCIVRKK